ncbi:transporter substrate-binding domain-containing protein [uncultured Rhodospira sp.]|uniref:transporter substrate-binding domain-containing protein n=1 Tax=uncultured Rhodospira sp. TaxID=1936189 RepID=UPI00260BE8D9|nr:transporter substrate-binding domain-containing protein [uncultured Rhodospira sp.]
MSVRRRLMIAILAASPMATPAFGQDLTVLMGDLPPHTNHDGTGREVEVIARVAKECGWTTAFQVEPFGRHWRSFEEGAADAVGTVPVGMDLGGSATDPYITYMNGVTLLDSTGVAPTSLADLEGLSVVTFANAANIIPGLAEAKDSFAAYREVADQITHSRLLFTGRVDVVLGEGMIVAEYNDRLGQEDTRIDTAQPATFSPIFAPTPYTLVFRDPALADAFDTCREAVADDIAAINATYIDRYRDVIGTAYDGNN